MKDRALKGDCVVWCETCQRSTPTRTESLPRKQHFYGCRGVPSDWRRVTCLVCGNVHEGDFSKD